VSIKDNVPSSQRIKSKRSITGTTSYAKFQRPGGRPIPEPAGDELAKLAKDKSKKIKIDALHDTTSGHGTTYTEHAVKLSHPLKIKQRANLSVNVAQAVRKRNAVRSSKVHKQSLEAEPRHPGAQADFVAKILRNKNTTEKNRQGHDVPKHWEYKEHHLTNDVRSLVDTLHPKSAVRKQVLDAFGHHWRRAALKKHKEKEAKWVESGGKGKGPHLHDFKYSHEGIITTPNGDFEKGKSREKYREHYEGKSKIAKFPVHVPTVKDFHHEVNSHYSLYPIGQSNKKLVKDGAKQRLMSSGKSTSELAHENDLPKLKQKVREHKEHLEDLHGQVASHEQDLATHREKLGKIKTHIANADRLFKQGKLKIRPHANITTALHKNANEVRGDIKQTKANLSDTHKRIASVRAKHEEAKRAVENTKESHEKAESRDISRTVSRNFLQEIKKGNSSATGSSAAEDIEKAQKAWITHATHIKNKSHPDFKEAHKVLYGDPKNKKDKGILAKYPKSKRFLTTAHSLYGSLSRYHGKVRDSVAAIKHNLDNNEARLKDQAHRIKNESRIVKSGQRRVQVPTVIDASREQQIKEHRKTLEGLHAQVKEAHKNLAAGTLTKEQHELIIHGAPAQKGEPKHRDKSKRVDKPAVEGLTSKIESERARLLAAKQSTETSARIHHRSSVQPITKEDRSNLSALKARHASELAEHHKNVETYNTKYKPVLERHAAKYEEHKANDMARSKAETERIEKARKDKSEARKAKIEENKKKGIENRNERGLGTRGIMKEKPKGVVVAQTKIGTSKIKTTKKPKVYVDNKVYLRHIAKKEKSAARMKKASRRPGGKKR
jgi:predicted  nucleic acid-binding Zn-ribbon protein